MGQCPGLQLVAGAGKALEEVEQDSPLPSEEKEEVSTSWTPSLKYREIALSYFLDLELERGDYDLTDECVFDLYNGDGEFLVCSYDEAIELTKDNLAEYLETVCDQLREQNDDWVEDLIAAVDEDIWKHKMVIAAQSCGGLGEFLATYDHEEHEVIVNGRTLFIYRIG